MISYKDWQKLQENTLFVGFKSNGIEPRAEELISDAEIDGIQTLDEAKKKMHDMKKKMTKKMFGDEECVCPKDDDKKDKKPSNDEKDDESDEDKEDDETGDGEMVEPSSKKDSPEYMKKCCKKMKKEDVEFFDSLRKQMNYDPNYRFDDGCKAYAEDALLKPVDPNAEVTEQE